MKNKRKNIQRRNIQRKNKKKNPLPFFLGLLGYFAGVFAINLASKGLATRLLFSPAEAIGFLGSQISIITGFPAWATLPFGFLLSLVPMIFFYVTSKEIIEKN